MPSPKGVITNKGSFVQAFYNEQDYIAQATTLVTPCTPDDSGHDAEGAPMEETAKAVVVLDQPSIGEADKTLGGSGGSAGPSLQALDPLEWAYSIKVSSNLSP
jgi:hypothetical protein